MNGELLRIVDSIHRDKNIDKEIIFQGVEAALLSAAKKHYDEEDEVEVTIDRESGNIHALHNGELIEPEALGRIASQTAKQVMIQKIREAERDALYEEYRQLQGEIVTGVVGRLEGGAVTVNLGKTEGILPRGEQIPGESYHAGERVRATVLDVRKSGTRVRIILSRTHPDFVRRLFELEIPEIAERVIEIKALAREAGYRTKVAVASIDQKVDCVGACVGVRGARIKNIVDELAGERLDIVRWNESLEVLIPNALQPAEVDDVILCRMLGRAIVLVREDQLSLAIGRRGQNVRLASKLCGWDMEIMTQEELDEQLDRAIEVFSQVPGVTEELATNLVQEGFFSYDDLSIIEPDDLMQLGNFADEQEVLAITAYAERAAEELERQKQEQRLKEQLAAQAAAEQEAEAAEEAAEQGEAPPTGEADSVGEAAEGEDEAPKTEGFAAEAAAGQEAKTDEAAGTAEQKTERADDGVAPCTEAIEQVGGMEDPEDGGSEEITAERVSTGALHEPVPGEERVAGAGGAGSDMEDGPEQSAEDEAVEPPSMASEQRVAAPDSGDR
jgi:N utilization substance protein A